MLTIYIYTVKLLEGNIHIEYMILVGGLEHFLFNAD